MGDGGDRGAMRDSRESGVTLSGTVVAGGARAAAHEDGFGQEDGARISTVTGEKKWWNGMVTQPREL